MTRLYIVVPCYNEQEVLPETSRRLLLKMQDLIESQRISEDSRVVYVDDGSKDATWDLIEKQHQENALFQGIKLAHNKGHQNALLAGLMSVREKADAVISMDADLQDDMDAMDAMLTRYEEGCEIVYGVRDNRDSDTRFKRSTAQWYYKIMNWLGTEVVYNHADYRLMSRKALDALAQYREVNLFLRGIVPELGYKTAEVYYTRAERYAGESKYPLRKMVSLAAEGITSFSVQPLKIISRLGILISFLSFAGLLYAVISKLTGNAVPGWAAIIFSIWLLGGLQLLCIGVVGTYIGKIYSESKARPRYIIEKRIGDEEHDTQ